MHASTGDQRVSSQTHLSSVLSDTFPQRLQDTVKRLDTIRRGSLGKSSQSKSSDGSHLLLFINQAYANNQNNQ